jgi:outer membrane protein
MKDSDHCLVWITYRRSSVFKSFAETAKLQRPDWRRAIKHTGYPYRFWEGNPLRTIRSRMLQKPSRGGWTIGALALVLALTTQTVHAQEVVPVTLSLEEAIEIARQNNPGFQQTKNDEGVADWNVRSAYGALVPSATIGGGISWQGSGEQRFGSLTAEQLGFGNQPSFWSSNYSLTLRYQLDGNTLLAPGQARANRTATRARTLNADASLVSQVTQLYIDVLRQSDQVTVSEQQLERSRFNHRLAAAQVEVGSASAIDEAQAAVALSRSEVTLIQTRNLLLTANVRLMQTLGVDVHREVQLTTPFILDEPRWEEDELFERGLEHSPNLRSLRASRDASSYGLKIAKSTYLPSLSFSAGLSGFSQQATSTEFQIRQAEASAQGAVQNCLFTNDLFSRLADPLPQADCTAFQFTDEQAQAIEKANDVFPFTFLNQPPSASMSISVPIFQGLNRQRQVETAQATLEDSNLILREQELALQADLAVGLANVRAAYESAILEDRNQVVVNEQLRLARERFSVGLADFVELLGAETLKVEADRTRIAAIFAYHDALASLEAIVGTSLRD